MSDIVMRAKMKVEAVTEHEGGNETVRMRAVCKEDSYGPDGADEDNTFAKFSPSASFEVYIANPALYGKFEVGQKYYVDFTRADVAPPVPAGE